MGKSKSVSRKLSNLVGKAVIVEWKDENDDWTCFRLEAINGDVLSFSGMTDEDGNHHDGSWVRGTLDEIKSINRRR